MTPNIRQIQDDEYLAALQADREKELRAVQEAELRRQEEAAAREAALERQKRDEEEKLRKQLEEEVLWLNLRVFMKIFRYYYASIVLW